MRSFIRFFIIFLLICKFSVSIASTPYSTLWKSVEAARQQDLPKTALASLEKIIAQAQAKGDVTQLLKGLLVKYQIAGDISPDSADIIIPLIQKSFKQERDAGILALSNCALGALYLNKHTGNHEENKIEALRYLNAAIKDLKKLQTLKASDYIPLIINGKDKDLFHDDLSNVIVRFTSSQIQRTNLTNTQKKVWLEQCYSQALQTYRDKQLAQPELFISIDSLRTLQSYYEQETVEKGWKKITEHFASDVYCAKAYDEWASRLEPVERYELLQEAIRKYPEYPHLQTLKNEVEQLELPQLSLSLDSKQTTPNGNDSIRVEGVNITHATLYFYRTNLKANSRIVRQGTVYEKRALMNNPTQKLSIEIPKGKPAETTKIVLPLTELAEGIWLVRAESDEGLRSDAEWLFVSHLHAMALKLPDGKTRILVTEAQNGHPISGASVSIVTGNASKEIFHGMTNAQGYVQISDKTFGNDNRVFVSHRGDEYFQSFNVWKNYYGQDTSEMRTNLILYTDRTIYRPGQRVQVGGFLFTQEEDSTRVSVGKTVKLHLYDANHQQIASDSLQTDTYGELSAQFELPKSCLNGHFSIEGEHGSTSFRVEEYKRPTFEVILDKKENSFKLGDTVSLSGTAKTYAGFALSQVPVAIKVVRQPAYFFWHSEPTETVLLDTLKCNQKGEFQIAVPLKSPEGKANPRFYTFTVSAAVTSDNGETEETSCILFASNRERLITLSLPEIICKEQPDSFTIQCKNASGEPIRGFIEAKLYTQGQKDTVIRQSQLPLQEAIDIQHCKLFEGLPSGDYTLEVSDEAEKNFSPAQAHFTYFSFNDTKLWGKKPLFAYQSSQELSQKGTTVLVGTTFPDAIILYDLYADGKHVESQLLPINNGFKKFNFTAKDSYRKGIAANFTLVHDGKVYTQTITCQKAAPNKHLDLHWVSFRDKLQVGQQETWTLSVTKGGKPVAASLIASMYDASLDKFEANPWNFNLSFDRNFPIPSWSYPYAHSVNLFLQKLKQFKGNQTFEFSHIDESLFYTRYGGLRSGRMLLSKMASPMAANLMVKNDAMAEETATYATDYKEAIPAVKNSKAEALNSAAQKVELRGSKNQFQAAELRTNFDETAFFLAKLTSDAQGQAVIHFTLPQSLTKWNFQAFAHTKDVDYGMLRASIEASKDFMLQPNLPRFLRDGDKTEFAVTLRNATASEQRGTACMEIINPDNQCVILSKSMDFQINANGESTLYFPYEAADSLPLLICKFYASNDRFSDGEQSYLPILSARQEVFESIPLSHSDAQSQPIDLNTLPSFSNPKASNRQLYLEQTSQPVWTAIEALPAMVNTRTENATTLALSYYALSLAAKSLEQHPALEKLVLKWQKQGAADSVFVFLERNPELKQIVLQETPWVAQANNERANLEAIVELYNPLTRSYRQQSLLDKLTSRQTAQGGWSWFEGMQPSVHITLYIAELLARLQTIHSYQPHYNGGNALTKAMKYLDNQMAERIVKMKAWEKKHRKTYTVGQEELQYLYIGALLNAPLDGTRAFLLQRIEAQVAKMNMFDKAHAALLLTTLNKAKNARTALQSLLEHTVSTPAMGRYFDTARASGYQHYGLISSQVATMEALLQSGDKTSTDEMLQWLIQSKRTERWASSAEAADAVSYLLRSPYANDSLTDGENILGYEFHSIPIPASGFLERPQLQVTGYGAVHARCTLPLSEIKSSASGITIQAQYAVQQGEQWLAVQAETPLHPGDVVRVTYHIKADRDYDFVSLKSGKAACLEPVHATSGYAFSSRCYRELGDSSILYYWDRLPKGDCTLTELFRIDRKGTFQSAPPSIQCVYAPEFGGTGSAQVLHVINP